MAHFYGIEVGRNYKFGYENRNLPNAKLLMLQKMPCTKLCVNQQIEN